MLSPRGAEHEAESTQAFARRKRIIAPHPQGNKDATRSGGLSLFWIRGGEPSKIELTVSTKTRQQAEPLTPPFFN